MILECKIHGFVKHYKRKNRPTGKSGYCSICSIMAVTRRRQKVKVMAVEYLGGKCRECGYNKCVAALEFHHTNPKNKEFGIASYGHTKSWEKVKEELDKCIILCANCHRELEYNEKRS